MDLNAALGFFQEGRGKGSERARIRAFYQMLDTLFCFSGHLLGFLFWDDCLRQFELSDDTSNVKVLSDQINLARCIDVIDEAHGQFVFLANDRANVGWKRPS